MGNRRNKPRHKTKLSVIKTYFSIKPNLFYNKPNMLKKSGETISF